MAHGKETPRQKMIGMMYLVLTALLALNVSREVLDAFVIVDKGLTKTTKNFADKNKIVYSDFAQRVAENPKLATKWQEMALEVKKQADQLTSRLQDLKIQIVNKSEGEKNKAVKGNEIDGIEIAAKDNLYVAGEIMVGDNNNGQAVGLKAGIKTFRDYLFSLIGDKNAPSLKSSLEKELNTENPPAKDNVTETWETEHFEHLPMIAVLTIMSSMQADIRNAEADILAYLYAQIDAHAFKFNQLEAIVIPKTDYVVQGDPFEAQLFIGAFDTTQPPRILVGNYEKKTLPDGTFDYVMKGSYDSIRTFKDGKGIYNIRPSGSGERKWQGLIVLKSPGGGPDIKKPFDSKYTVNAPSVTVSPTKMNVFYRGVDNPVEVAASGFSGDKVSINLSNGTYKKIAGSYLVSPSKLGNAQVTVMVDIDGKKKSMGTKEFRVKDLPDPVAKVGGKKSQTIEKSWLGLQSRITAELEGSEFEHKFTILEFTVSATQGGFSFDKISKSDLITAEQNNLIKNSARGQKVRFEDIKVMGPEGTPRLLQTLTFKIN